MKSLRLEDLSLVGLSGLEFSNSGPDFGQVAPEVWKVVSLDFTFFWFVWQKKTKYLGVFKYSVFSTMFFTLHALSLSTGNHKDHSDESEFATLRLYKYSRTQVGSCRGSAERKTEGELK